MIEAITQSLPSELTTVILLAGLVIVFYLAYKILSMVTQTILIAALSGIFYATLTSFLDLQLTLQNVLFFSLTGAALYLLYTIIETTVSIATHLIKIPVKLIEIIIYPIRKLIGRTKKKLNESKNKSNQNNNKKTETKKQEKNNTKDEKDTKEVVIDKVSKDEEN